MKKLIIVISIVFAMLAFAGLSNQVYAEETLGCYNMNHGQLRVVSDHSECSSAEEPIILNQTTGGQTGQLACVTAAVRDATVNSAEIIITNQKNISVSDWSDVFNPLYIQPNPYDPSGTSIIWGLQCNDDWVNTGCTQGSRDGYNAGLDRDIFQFDNGCVSDDEEVQKLVIMTTCCTIVN